MAYPRVLIFKTATSRKQKLAESLGYDPHVDNSGDSFGKSRNLADKGKG